MKQGETLYCINCKSAVFPSPSDQCYKFGGLICRILNTNVGKYDKCHIKEQTRRQQIDKSE